MSKKLGKDGKLYYCEAGIGGTPDWSELTNARDVTLGLTKGEADVTTRGNAGWKASAATLKEGTIEWEMVWDPSDEGFTAVKDAWFNNTTLGLAVMDGDIATAGSQGLWADCDILDFSREEPLDGAMIVKVTAKPTYTANAPQWKTIPAA